MTNDQITINRIQYLVAEQTGVTPRRVTPGARFNEDLGYYKLNYIELVMALEEEFGVELPDGAVDSLKTVGELADRIIWILRGTKH